jgi:hypothetical protein
MLETLKSYKLDAELFEGIPGDRAVALAAKSKKTLYPYSIKNRILDDHDLQQLIRPELYEEFKKKYHYKIMMPYFTDAVTLNEFSSFEQGVKTIEANLKAKKGATVLVYKLVYEKENVAVFGIGLQDKAKGESHFLPIIGEDNIAAMPYEIILQGKKATMLPGKYRLAVSWPELSMGTFMKIVSTPGNIEDTLKAVCK